MALPLENEQAGSAALHASQAVFNHDSGWEKIVRLFPAGERLAVCDAGCGDARLSEVLVARGHTVVGLDAHAEAVTVARTRGVEAHLADIEHAWPVASGSQDVVLLLDVLEHTVNHAAVLAQARRVLKPAGALLVVYPNHFDLRQRLEMLWGRGIVHWSHHKYQASAAQYGHLRFLRLPELQALLLQCGFAVEVVQLNFMGGGVVPRRIVPAGIRRWLAGRWPNLFSGKFGMRAVLGEVQHTEYVVLDTTPTGL